MRWKPIRNWLVFGRSMVTFKFRAFLDTNVLLDVLSTSERPSSEASEQIFEAIRSGIFEGFITTQSIIDAAYILSRQRSRAHRPVSGLKRFQDRCAAFFGAHQYSKILPPTNSRTREFFGT